MSAHLSADYAGDDERGRRVYLVLCDRFEHIARIQPPQTPFQLFIAADSTHESVELLADLAEKMLESGAVYVLCWGPGAGRLEDIFDEVHVGRSLDTTLPIVMTTSHQDESLQDALTFATTVAEPDEAYAGSCATTLVVIVENVNWYNEAQNSLEDLLRSGVR